MTCVLTPFRWKHALPHCVLQSLVAGGQNMPSWVRAKSTSSNSATLNSELPARSMRACGFGTGLASARPSKVNQTPCCHVAFKCWKSMPEKSRGIKRTEQVREEGRRHTWPKVTEMWSRGLGNRLIRSSALCCSMQSCSASAKPWKALKQHAHRKLTSTPRTA